MLLSDAINMADIRRWNSCIGTRATKYSVIVFRFAVFGVDRFTANLKGQFGRYSAEFILKYRSEQIKL